MVNMRWLASALAIASSLLCVAACSSSANENSSGSKVFKLSLADHLTNTDPLTLALEAMAARVSKDTEGHVQIKVYPNAQLTSEDDAISAVKSGSVDMAISPTDLWTTAIPGIDVMSAPTVINTWQQAGAVAESKDINSYLGAEFSKQGVHLLANIPEGVDYLLSQKLVEEPSEMKGMKIRIAGGGITEDAVNALGAFPVTLSSSELFESLLTHAVSGGVQTIDNVVASKLYQAAHYYILASFGMSFIELSINSADWRQLSVSDQAAVTKEAQALIPAYVIAGERDEQQKEAAISAGGGQVVKISDVDAWDSALSAVVTKARSSSEFAARLYDLVTQTEKSAG